MRTIAVINLKGGVAKTVTTNSVAYILASQGEIKCLLWITISREMHQED